jgi:hypothetical protein
MPVRATASAMRVGDRMAASCFTRSRWAMTSASNASSPVSRFNVRSRIATSSWQSMPSILNTDSA